MKALMLICDLRGSVRGTGAVRGGSESRILEANLILRGWEENGISLKAEYYLEFQGEMLAAQMAS